MLSAAAAVQLPHTLLIEAISRHKKKRFAV